MLRKPVRWRRQVEGCDLQSPRTLAQYLDGNTLVHVCGN